MKKINLSIWVPEALHEQFQRLPSHCSAELNLVLLAFVRRLCDMAADDQRKSGDHQLPQSDNPTWGQAWSRRWDDQKGEAFMQAERTARRMAAAAGPTPASPNRFT